MECDYSKSHFSMELEATRSAPSYRYDSVSDGIVSIGALVERISVVESDLTANSEDPFIVIFDAMKSKVSKFDGADPEGWISQIDGLFNSYNAPEEWRLRLVSYHMEGRADDWFLWSLANNHLLTWTEFKFRLQQYFGCPIYEPNFAESHDTVSAGNKNLKSANAELLFEEAISSAECVQEEFGAETDNFELTSTTEKESRGNLGEKNLNSSGSSESAHPEDPKLEVKSEPNTGSHGLAQPNTGSHGLALAHFLASIPVFPLAYKVFDEMTVTDLSSFKEPDVYVNFWEHIQNFMEGKERNKNTHRSDLLFDPGGGGRISNIWQINPLLKILSHIIPLSDYVAATKGRGCLTIQKKYFPIGAIIPLAIYHSLCVSSFVWVIVWFIICRTYDGCNGPGVIFSWKGFISLDGYGSNQFGHLIAATMKTFYWWYEEKQLYVIRFSKRWCESHCSSHFVSISCDMQRGQFSMITTIKVHMDMVSSWHFTWGAVIYQSISDELNYLWWLWMTLLEIINTRQKYLPHVHNSFYLATPSLVHAIGFDYKGLAIQITQMFMDTNGFVVLCHCVGIALWEKLKVGRAGSAQGIINEVREQWRRFEILKIMCEEICKLNMKRTGELVEREAGGLIVWQSGSNKGAGYLLLAIATGQPFVPTPPPTTVESSWFLIAAILLTLPAILRASITSIVCTSGFVVRQNMLFKVQGNSRRCLWSAVRVMVVPSLTYDVPNLLHLEDKVVLKVWGMIHQLG